MAATTLPKSGLQTQAFKDRNWHTGLNAGLTEFEARLGLTYAGDPNGNVAGSWYGQTCWDTVGLVLYVCTTTGIAASAVWAPVPQNPVGELRTFFGATIPSGFLACDGTQYLKATYPALSTFLGVDFSVDDDNFTVPDLQGALLVGAAGDDPVKKVVAGSSVKNATIASGGGHTHSGTVGGTALTTAQMPAHSHTVRTHIASDSDVAATKIGVGKASTPGSAPEPSTNSAGSGETHTHSLTMDSGGAHSHAWPALLRGTVTFGIKY